MIVFPMLLLNDGHFPYFIQLPEALQFSIFLYYYYNELISGIIYLVKHKVLKINNKSNAELVKY